jgi:DNA polymerase elongation subunit (family B)
VKDIDCVNEDFEFFCIDIDNYVDRPPKYMPMDTTRDVSVSRLYGITADGNSVAIHAFNFKPYFYIQIPNSMDIDESHMEDLKKYFNTKLQNGGIENCELT